MLHCKLHFLTLGNLSQLQLPKQDRPDSGTIKSRTMTPVPGNFDRDRKLLAACTNDSRPRREFNRGGGGRRVVRAVLS